MFRHVKKFRQVLYDLIPLRRDATMNLIDALSSNDKAGSVVQLSLNPLFKRTYSSITDAIHNFFPDSQEKPEENGLEETPSPKPDSMETLESDKCEIPVDEQKDSEVAAVAEAKGSTSSKKVPPIKTEESTPSFKKKELNRLIAGLCTPPSEKRAYYLFAADCTSAPRPYAAKLSDRSVVYSPNPVLKNKPIAIGHQYAHLVYLPETTPETPPWVLPLSVQRVNTKNRGHEVDIALMTSLLDDPVLDFKNQLCVLACDSAHTTTNCRREIVDHSNLIMLARMRSNRNVYSQPKPDGSKKRFGKKMKLNKGETHRTPDAEERIEITTPNGNERIAVLQMWENMMVRGEAGFRADEHPFTLVKVSFLNSKGKKIYKKPMWLIAQGERRGELSCQDIYESYGQRFDIEHYFRFGKQRLLLDKFQTPDTTHEENWWKLTQLAYIQLYLAKDGSRLLPYDWERHLRSPKEEGISPPPSHVMRDFFRIVGETGTPAKDPKLRGIAPGRSKEDTQEPRPDEPIIYKSKKKSTAQKESAKSSDGTDNGGKEKSTGFENKGDSPKPDNLEQVLLLVSELLKKLDVSPEKFLKNAHLMLST